MKGYLKMGILDFFKSKKTMEVFPFNENPNTAVFTCQHIINKEKPITYVFHDNEGEWQFLCDESHGLGDAKMTSLYNMYKLDNSISQLTNLAYGEQAERANKDSEWKITKNNE